MYSTTQGGQHRPATKTAMLTMGGVRVQSPYKLLMGCTGAKVPTREAYTPILPR